MCARQEGTAAAAQALEKLCKVYWPPLYAYVRRSGHSPVDAQDLTQSFFEKLLADDRFRWAERSRGRFRTFLLTSLKNYLVNEWRRNARQKRGSGLAHFSFDCQPEEAAYCEEPVDRESPDVLYERRWAARLLEEVGATLRREYERAGQGPMYDSILPVMWGDPDSTTYGEIASRLGTTGGAVKVAVHRLRQRFRQRLRETVAATLPESHTPEDVLSEMRYLQEVLQQNPRGIE